MPVDIGGGVIADTVGDLLSPPTEFLEVEAALEMPRLPDTPEPPPCGIHFGMDEETYHAIPAFSKSHLHHLLCSPTAFWADSWLNPDREDRSAEHLHVGKAYHAMILEGHGAYTGRFYPAPDPKDYPQALRSVDEIKQALDKLHQTPVSKVPVPGTEGKTRAAKKEDWVAQLMAYDRSQLVWDDIVAKAERIAAGRTLLPCADDRRIRIAARMIMQDPQLAKAFSGGFPEVVLIWRDPRQGVLCKSRIDYLKLRAVVDLKTFANKRDRSVRKAILHAIAENRYCLQPAVYLSGVDAVRKLVRERGKDAIFVHGGFRRYEDGALALDDPQPAIEFATKWAENTTPDRWLWVFQMKGEAPVTRGLWHPLASTVHSFSQSLFVEGLRKFRELAEIYGNDPWLDLAEVDDIDESEIPLWSMDF